MLHRTSKQKIGLFKWLLAKNSPDQMFSELWNRKDASTAHRLASGIFSRENSEVDHFSLWKKKIFWLRWKYFFFFQCRRRAIWKTVNSSQLIRCRNICVNEIPAPLLYWLDGALTPAKNNYRTEKLTLNTHRQMASSRVQKNILWQKVFCLHIRVSYIPHKGVVPT